MRIMLLGRPTGRMDLRCVGRRFLLRLQSIFADDQGVDVAASGFAVAGEPETFDEQSSQHLHELRTSCAFREA